MLKSLFKFETFSFQLKIEKLKYEILINWKIRIWKSLKSKILAWKQLFQDEIVYHTQILLIQKCLEEKNIWKKKII